MNDKTDGRDTGTISDIEFPAEASDKVTAAAFVGPRITKFATVRSIAVGTGSGAFRARTTAAVGGTTPQTPVGQTPAAQTPAAQTPTAPVVQQPTQQQPTVGTPVAAAPKVVTVGVKKTTTVASALRTLGIAVVAKSKVVTATTTKTVCSVLPGNKVKGLKAGVCRLTVKITPPKTKKVPKPKTTTKRITVTIK
jgi:hypothetical protein